MAGAFSPSVIAQSPKESGALAENRAERRKAGLCTRLRFLRLAVGLILRADDASLDAALDFEVTSHFPVVITSKSARFDIGLDLQATSHRLVVVLWHPVRAGRKVSLPGFDVRFDFHVLSLLLMDVDGIN